MTMLFHRQALLLLALAAVGLAGCGSDMKQGRITASISKKAAPGHIKNLKHESADVRREAAHALWQIGAETPEATPYLIESLHDKDAEVRAEAARALGRTGLGEKKVIPALLAAAKDEQAPVRVCAAESLWELQVLARAEPQTVVPALVEALNDQDEIKIKATRLLTKFGNAAKPASARLQELLKSSNTIVRLDAAAALAAIGPDARAALPALLELAKSNDDVSVRVTATRALGSVAPGDKSTVPFLIEQIKGGNELMQEAAAWALYGIGPEAKEALPALNDALKNDKIRQPVKMAINSINGRRQNLPNPADSAMGGMTGRGNRGQMMKGQMPGMKGPGGEKAP